MQTAKLIKQRDVMQRAQEQQQQQKKPAVPAEIRQQVTGRLTRSPAQQQAEARAKFKALFQ